MFNRLPSKLPTRSVVSVVLALWGRRFPDRKMMGKYLSRSYHVTHVIVASDFFLMFFLDSRRSRDPPEASFRAPNSPGGGGVCGCRPRARGRGRRAMPATVTAPLFPFFRLPPLPPLLLPMGEGQPLPLSNVPGLRRDGRPPLRHGMAAPGCRPPSIWRAATPLPPKRGQRPMPSSTPAAPAATRPGGEAVPPPQAAARQRRPRPPRRGQVGTGRHGRWRQSSNDGGAFRL